jgi:uncharacterized protein YciI
MKNILTITLLLLFANLSFGQNVNPKYDSTFAKKLGADEYGMKKYIFVMLKTGTNKTMDKAFIDSCFAGHMANIRRMVDQGKLIVAGPMGKNDNSYKGIFILNVSTKEEANELLQTDPAIAGKLLEADIYNWYGSAALPEYLEASERIWKINP